MYHLLTIVAVYFSVNPSAGLSFLDAKVSNGVQAPVDKFPYVAALENNGKHICSATIIGSKTLITSAHCIESIKDHHKAKVRVGSIRLQSGGELFEIAKTNVHTLYDLLTKTDYKYLYDIGIIWLKQNLTFDNAVNKISIASSKDHLPAYKFGLLTGWGRTLRGKKPLILQFAIIPFWDTNECKQVHGELIDDSTLCAGNPKTREGSCPGDSGSPLIRNGKLYGVASWGLGCGHPAPGVYANIAYLSSWIKSTLKTKRKLQ